MCSTRVNVPSGHMVHKRRSCVRLRFSSSACWRLGLDWEETTDVGWYNVALRGPLALTGLMRAEDSRSKRIQPLVRIPLFVCTFFFFCIFFGIFSCTYSCLHRMPFSPS